jgi:hypothetical protein
LFSPKLTKTKRAEGKIRFERRRGCDRGGFLPLGFATLEFGIAAMSILQDFRSKKESGARINFRSPEWVNRFYFLFGYFTGLCALLTIGYSIFGDFSLAPQTREHKGWDLSRPEKIDTRMIGR